MSTSELVVLIVMVNAPFVTLWGGLPAVFQYGHVVATPLVYLLAGLIFVTFILGSVGVARCFPHQGGWYPVVARGLGGRAALGVATVSVLASALYVGMFLVFSGSTLRALADTIFGINLPSRLATLLVALLVGGLALLRLRFVLVAVAVVGVIELGAVLWFSEVAVSHPAGGSVSFEGLSPGWLVSGSFGMALVFAASSFAGSEIGPAYAADIRDARRSVPRATLIALSVKIVTVTLAAWSLTVATGPENAVFLTNHQNATTDSAPFLLAILIGLIGPQHALTLAHLTIVLLTIGSLTAAIAQLHTAARQITGLGADGLLSRSFHTSPASPPRRVTFPLIAILSGGFAVIMVNPTDPRPMLLVGLSGGIAVTLVLTLVSFSSALWLLRTDDTDIGFFGWEGRVVAAGLSMVTSGFLCVSGAIKAPAVIYPDAPVSARLIVVGSVLGAFLAGIVWGSVLKARDPAAFARIGRAGTLTADGGTHLPTTTAATDVRSQIPGARTTPRHDLSPPHTNIPSATRAAAAYAAGSLTTPPRWDEKPTNHNHTYGDTNPSTPRPGRSIHEERHFTFDTQPTGGPETTRR